MILKQNVKTVWTTLNRKWYESKGYIFTKYKDNLLVSVEDLCQGSRLAVKLQCDSCGEIYDCPYQDYIRRKGKDICKQCRLNNRIIKYGMPDNGLLNLTKFICYDFKDGMGIYKITNTNNNKIYIGSSVDLLHRKATHISKLNSNSHDNIYLQRSFNKYNGDGFIFDVVEFIEDVNLLIEREQYWIDLFQSYNPELGYNLCRIAGSTLGRKLTEEHKRKLSIAKKGKPLTTRLTSEQVQEIKYLINNDVDLSIIANKYNVKKMTIKNIKYRRTWNAVS